MSRLRAGARKPPTTQSAPRTNRISPFSAFSLLWVADESTQTLQQNIAKSEPLQLRLNSRGRRSTRDRAARSELAAIAPRGRTQSKPARPAALASFEGDATIDAAGQLSLIRSSGGGVVRIVVPVTFTTRASERTVDSVRAQSFRCNRQRADMEFCGSRAMGGRERPRG